jgi:hypothetical protein
MATPVDLAAHQHLAHLRQEDLEHQREALAAVQALERDQLDLRQQHQRHQQALAEAGLEAHLQQQHQERK